MKQFKLSQIHSFRIKKRENLPFLPKKRSKKSPEKASCNLLDNLTPEKCP
jgi:hypothetical protein